ncbi:hypothetical protein [Streptomyces niveus]|uniref:hypothetical protein n=1 Tax=Streptomyces niveus TaxID=193462 RepID=UPI003437345F
MEQSEQDRQPPWWYRIPPLAVGLIAYSVAGIVIHTVVSTSGVVWAGGGLAACLAAAFFHGMAQAAYDRRHR